MEPNRASGSSANSGDETGPGGDLQDGAVSGYNTPGRGSAPESETDTLIPDEDEKPTAMATRAYQTEMLEASLKQNIIVAVRAGGYP